MTTNCKCSLVHMKCIANNTKVDVFNITYLFCVHVVLCLYMVVVKWCRSLILVSIEQ